MSSKLSLVSIVLALISATTQLSLVPKNEAGRLHHGLDFKKVVEHLTQHSGPHHDQHTSGAATNLLNIQNVHLHLNRGNERSAVRSDNQQKLCQVGRCGCSGYRCDDDRDGNDERREQDRCSGDRCDESLQDGEDRCGCRHKGDVRDGDRCGCGRSDVREGDDRCGCRHKGDVRDGDRCGCGRSDVREGDDRCGCRHKGDVRDGDRCGCGKSDVREGDDRCGCRHKSDLRDGDRCGCGRSDVREGDDRCGCRHKGDVRDGDRCGCARSDDREDDDEDKTLRCANDRCGKGDTRSESDLKSELERYGKKYKINNELDAIVLDLSNLNGLLDKLNDRKGRKIEKQKFAYSVPDLDLDYYFSLDDDDERSERSDDVAYVIDVDQNDAVNQEDALFGIPKTKDSSKPKFASELYEANQINELNKAWNYVNNKRGDKDLSSLSRKQRYLLQKLKSQNQYTQGDEIDLWSQVKRVLDLEQDKSRVLMKKMIQGVQPSVGYKFRERDLRTKKRLFPLTAKQKLKLMKHRSRISLPLSAQSLPLSLQAQEPRRVVRETEQYGVPFELQIEGLGQVNPE